ncbi:hypothetical protein DTO166G4_9065 [Paecilomyces variotii]|nr:hypothetical protein DTO164E3_4039 [Paecilomyces variotii]KAJ9208268.1 hypothetical protein DTO032I3_939 [Paecilomyces variotii]KAJ9209332.1 hypothetical protein DTO166G4_9065 [Paecilomyces variotii]KAJ9242579.1 hypothetical protein DTO166G5_334 [Paecilomyces variotii]KAJ9282279.1 hypothetical protein DTO021D3_1031 [Paecilomyces variotii]
MSRASKVTLALTTAATAGIVYFVHWSQEADRAAMHAGVERDVERQRIKQERQAEFEMQRRLEEEYRKIQTDLKAGIMSVRFQIEKVTGYMPQTARALEEPEYLHIRDIPTCTI